MARARRGAGSRAHGRRDARGRLDLRRAARRARAPARRRSQARGAGPGERVAIALPGGPRVRRRRCTRACCWAPSAVPVDLRLAAQERERVAARRRGRSWTSRCPADGRRACRGRPPRPRRRPRSIVHTSGTTAAPQAGRADLRQPAVERARLGASRSARPASERWLCTLPLSHVGGLSILIRSAIYGDDRGRARALRDRPRAARADATAA